MRVTQSLKQVIKEDAFIAGLVGTIHDYIIGFLKRILNIFFFKKIQRTGNMLCTEFIFLHCIYEHDLFTGIQAML
jgi:hypothetical protein